MAYTFISALRRQRHAIFEYEASLVYRVNFRIVQVTQRNPVSENKNKKERRKGKEKLRSGGQKALF